MIGTGLAALPAGCFLVRDAQMPGRNIHFFDRDPIAGGACDGWNCPEIGHVLRGGRESACLQIRLKNWRGTAPERSPF